MSDASLFKAAGEAQASSSPAAKKVAKLAIEAAELSSNIEGLEEMLKTAKARLNLLKIKEIPDALAEFGSTTWTNPDAEAELKEVKLEDFVAGSLPKDPDERKKAIHWLEEHDGKPLIKTEITMVFDKTEHNMAMDIFEGLKKKTAKCNNAPAISSGVHPQSLLAYARERQKKGHPVNFEVLGLFAGRQAKIKIVKLKEAPVVADPAREALGPHWTDALPKVRPAAKKASDQAFSPKAIAAAKKGAKKK